MSVREKIGNFLFNIDGMVEKRVGKMILEYNVPGSEIQSDNLLKFRQREYQVWSKGNVGELLEFYGLYRITPGEVGAKVRQLWWEWVYGVDNVPKMHFPTAEIVMNQMKSLLFAEDLDISLDIEDENIKEETTEELMKILQDNDINEKYQTGSYMETYSGSLGYKMVMDTEVNEYPIIIPYPAERMRFKAKYNKVQEIIFLDNYNTSDKKYILKAIYGKGYIKHRLFEIKGDKEVLVSVDTLEETKGLKDHVFMYDGKLLPIMMATYKKNRSVSNEFPNSLYGGSDFEGVLDIFHMIDEIYSTKSAYIRRTRPLFIVDEKALGYDQNTGKEKIPKEIEKDILIKRGDKDSTEITRDIKEINPMVYDESIKSELKSLFTKIGMAYTTVGLEGVGANQSGAALEIREKSTIIVRSNKIKLWQKFLQDTFRLLLIYNSLPKSKIEESEEGYTYTLTDTFDFKIDIEFPMYNEQSFEDKLNIAMKALSGQVMDVKTAVDYAMRNEKEEVKKEIVKNIKIENGIPLIGDQLNANTTE